MIQYESRNLQNNLHSNFSTVLKENPQTIAHTSTTFLHFYHSINQLADRQETTKKHSPLTAQKRKSIKLWRDKV